MMGIEDDDSLNGQKGSLLHSESSSHLQELSDSYSRPNYQVGDHDSNAAEELDAIILKSSVTSNGGPTSPKSSYDKTTLLESGATDKSQKQPQTKQKENIYKKLLVVVLICNLAFPLYLAYNSPNSLVEVFDRHYNIDSAQFSLLYTVYALPNLFMVILGGILVDLFGPNICSLVFQVILFSSSILSAISVSSSSYGLLLFSKVLLGIGGETILVCISSFIAKWFSESDVPFVLGLESFWVQIASFLSFALLPSLYNATNLNITLWFIAVVSVVALFSNTIFVLLQKHLKYREETYTSVGDDVENEKESEKEQQVKEMNVNSEKDEYARLSKNELQSMSKSQRLVYELRQAALLIKLIPKKMWILACISFFGYNCFYGLDIFVTDMIIEKYGYSNKKASLVMAYETVINGIFAPIFGYLVKRWNMRATACGIGIFVMGLGVAILNLTSTPPYPWVIMSGLGYALMNNTIMSSIPIIVEDRIIGSSYGLVGTAYNVGIFVFPYLLGACKTRLGTYDVSMWLLVVSAAFALALLIWLKLIDMKETDNSKRLDKKRDEPILVAS